MSITSQATHRRHYEIGMDWVRNSQICGGWELGRSPLMGVGVTQASCRTREEGEDNPWMISGLLMMDQAVSNR